MGFDGGGILVDGATLTISNCVITGNSAYCGGGVGIVNNLTSVPPPVTIIDSTISSNTASFLGGGIYNDDELGSVSLAIGDSIITNNIAQYGGGIYNDGYTGSATLAIANSTVSGNTAVIPGGLGLGGGIVNDGTSGGNAMLTIVNAIVNNNSASYGGGIYTDSDSGSATLTITKSTFIGNFSAYSGGGIFNNGESGGAMVTIAGSTFSANTANTGEGLGGGIYNDQYNGSNATMSIVDSTLSGNSANILGGGVFNRRGTLSITDTTVSENSAGGIGTSDGTVFVANSTLNSNSYWGDIRMETAVTNPVVEIGSTILNSTTSVATISGSGTVTSLGFNISSDDGGGFLTAVGDRISTDPMLGLLANNGGPTFTHGLLPGSPAINQGKNFSGSTYDQRGPAYARTYDDPAVPIGSGGDGTDIGAFEVQPPACSTVVTTTADGGPGSLRAALSCASEGDIVDATGISGVILLTGGELVVSNDINILGPGAAALAVSGDGASRVFHLVPGVTVTISGLSITNGVAGGLLPPDQGGGGIFNDHSTLTLNNCAIVGNSAPASSVNGGQGGGIDNSGTLNMLNCMVSGNSTGGSGGGVLNDVGTTLNITGVTFSGNNALAAGGGILNEVGATVSVKNSTIDGNGSVSGGGGIANSGTLVLTNTLLSGNSTGSNGGGILNNASATLTVTTTSLNANISAAAGGGINNDGTQTIGYSTVNGNSAQFGGGFYNGTRGHLTITNCTVSSNSAATGGGIENHEIITIINSTISGNSATTNGGGINNILILTILNSTFSGNLAPHGGAISHYGGYLEIGSTILNAGTLGGNIANFATPDTIYMDGYNLSSDDAAGLLNLTGDRTNIDPMLGPLANNGGPTLTHAPLPGSPAIDQGVDFGVYYPLSPFDQRGPGFSRTRRDPALPLPPGGDGTDIGAFEIQQPPCSTVVTTIADNGLGSLRSVLDCASPGATIDATRVSGTVLLTGGELLITKNINILGPGPGILAVNGNAASRVFHISSNAVVSISGLTITNGSVSGTNFPADGGGGIYNDHATLTVSNCIISGNFASSGGGGILNNGDATLTDGQPGNATMTIVNSSINQNRTSSSGGGIYNDADGVIAIGLAGNATLTIVNSTLNGNSATVNGGGVLSESRYYGDAALTVSGSTISSNTASDCGGLYSSAFVFSSATLAVSNSTISGNSATNGNGGGMENAGILMVVNSTISGNSAIPGSGGAIFNFNSILQIGSTILNAGPSGGTIFNNGFNATSLGYNLSSDSGGNFLTATGDQINVDPLLGPLQDNGGPTFTHALLCGSPAIDAGKNFSGSAYDQRGSNFVRTFDDPFRLNAIGGDGTDIGAFEVQTVCNHAPIASCTNVTVGAGANGAADASINSGSYDPDPGDIITVTQLPPGPYPLGTNNVTLIVTDNHGASNSCMATVIVVDKNAAIHFLPIQYYRRFSIIGWCNRLLSATDRYR